VKKTLIAGALMLPLVGAGTYVGFRRTAPRIEPAAFRSGIFEPAREAPAFLLDGSNGKKVSLRDHLGKVVIMEFGYTSCEFVCPVTLGRLTEVYRKLGDQARDVQLIYVTVDPKRDNPARLREHLAGYNSSFLGATGTSDELASVLKAYGVVAEEVVSKSHAHGYEVNHSSFLYLVDQQGKIRGLVPFGTPADDILHDLELLLKKT
jgi:protein SCO1